MSPDWIQNQVTSLYSAHNPNHSSIFFNLITCIMAAMAAPVHGWECLLCGCRFSRRKHLRAHIQDHHVLLDARFHDGQMPDFSACQFCAANNEGKPFSSKHGVPNISFNNLHCLIFSSSIYRSCSCDDPHSIKASAKGSGSCTSAGQLQLRHLGRSCVNLLMFCSNPFLILLLFISQLLPYPSGECLFYSMKAAPVYLCDVIELKKINSLSCWNWKSYFEVISRDTSWLKPPTEKTNSSCDSCSDFLGDTPVSISTDNNISFRQVHWRH